MQAQQSTCCHEMERTHRERFAGTRCPKQLLGGPVFSTASHLMDNAIRDP